jgi:hypothetical protein
MKKVCSDEECSDLIIRNVVKTANLYLGNS